MILAHRQKACLLRGNHHRPLAVQHEIDSRRAHALVLDDLIQPLDLKADVCDAGNLVADFIRRGKGNKRNMGIRVQEYVADREFPRFHRFIVPGEIFRPKAGKEFLGELHLVLSFGQGIRTDIIASYRRYAAKSLVAKGKARHVFQRVSNPGRDGDFVGKRGLRFRAAAFRRIIEIRFPLHQRFVVGHLDVPGQAPFRVRDDPLHHPGDVFHVLFVDAELPVHMIGFLLRHKHQPLLGQMDRLFLHGRSSCHPHAHTVVHRFLPGVVKSPEGNGAEDKEGKQPRRNQQQQNSMTNVHLLHNDCPYI